MQYCDLREFISYLEQNGELKRVVKSVSPNLEMTEFCAQVLKKSGPAIIFENPTGYTIPVLGNLFGTVNRVVLAMGKKNIFELRELRLFYICQKLPKLS